MNIPSELKYSSEHEWVRLNGDTAVVGITDYAQNALGDITFVDLPSVGDIVEEGDETCVVESVKAASDVYAPLGGEIIEVNHALDNEPEKINADPYGEGWIFKLKNVDRDAFENLLSSTDYEALLEED